MSVSLDYIRIGKSYSYNGNTYQIYGQTSITTPGSNWYGISVNSASSYDCDGFGYNNQYLWIWACRFSNDGDSSTNVACKVEIQASVDGTRESRETLFQTSYSLSVGASKQIWGVHGLEAGIIDDSTTSYRVRVILADSDNNITRYSTFSISNCPQSGGDITLYSNTVGKSLKNGGSILQTFWGKEEGSINFDSIGYADSTSGETTIGCSGLQPGHYACVANLVLNIPGGIGTDTITLRFELQGYIDGVWENIYTDIMGNYEVEGGYYWSWWQVMVIAENSIRTNTNSYRARWFWVSQGGHGYGDHKKGFTISNLSVDGIKHTPGCMWIDGGYVYYTDQYGYKHHIDTDGASDGYVGTDYKGSIRMVDSGLTDMRKLYYVTETGYIWHTHTGRLKARGQSLSPGIDYKGSLWAEDYCLCFINANGEKVYMGNGDVT